ncbi:hypothetical protein E2N92_09150 [Methanofollis formosanus]|uniref:Uncharacterized protein n=1 Tax=Methanofollis formosanus TaxID=299308 RepID=A0A8G1A2X6_9EURY|nr:hypothetical protein [Methanofollis formosanus]QYZ79585.1 hypothetical protein E2N92_09150 [Methanofollis formosanus]
MPLYLVEHHDPRLGTMVLASSWDLAGAQAERVRLAAVFGYSGLRLRKVFDAAVQIGSRYQR